MQLLQTQYNSICDGPDSHQHQHMKMTSCKCKSQ